MAIDRLFYVGDTVKVLPSSVCLLYRGQTELYLEYLLLLLFKLLINLGNPLRYQSRTPRTLVSTFASSQNGNYFKRFNSETEEAIESSLKMVLAPFFAALVPGQDFLCHTKSR